MHNSAKHREGHWGFDARSFLMFCEQLMSFKIMWERHGVHAVFSGELNATKVLDATIKIQSDPRYDDLRFIILDYTRVMSFSFDSAVLDEVMAHRYGAAYSNARVRIAIVACDEKLLAGIAIEISESQPCEMAVFTDLETARSWCGQQK